MKKLQLILVIFLATSFHIGTAATFHIDPINGSNLGDGSVTNPWKTLETVVSQNLIESQSYVTPYNPNNPQLIAKNQGALVKPGDTLLLYTGLHGELFLVNYINSKTITIIAKTGHQPILKSIRFQGAKNWVIQNIHVSSEPYGNYINSRLVFLESHGWQGPVSSIEINNCTIYSTTAPWIIANDWVTKASDGIFIQGDSIQVKNNQISNIDMGISMLGDYILVANNTITNFSGDGIRLLGSFNVVDSNTIKNCYQVNANHDDGIQSFTTGGLIVDQNTITRNTIINYENPNQPLLGDLQGIGCFDGFYNDWIIENNLIIVNHWHGISMYGTTNCRIVNNTVLDPSPSVSPGPVNIRIKDLNGVPSTGCVVKNNVTNALDLTPNTVSSHNIQLVSFADYSNNFVDYTTNDFHLLSTSSLINAGDASIAPLFDMEGNQRPAGTAPDVGAFEFQNSVSVTPISNSSFLIYPNPANNFVTVIGTGMESIEIYTVDGRLIQQHSISKSVKTISTSELNNGIYIFKITTPTRIFTKKVVITD